MRRLSVSVGTSWIELVESDLACERVHVLVMAGASEGMLNLNFCGATRTLYCLCGLGRRVFIAVDC